MSADNKKGEAGGISELPVLTRTTASAALGFEIAHNGEDEKDSPSSEADEGAKSIPGVIPLKYRLTAVAMILFISTGTAFAEVTMGPLKSTLQRELGLNNVQFATISTASNLVNTLLPAIGGIVMDYFGAGHTALAACGTCIIGSVVAACSANTGQHSLLIIGRILLGFGSIVIEICQNKLYAHWFAGSTLSFIVAIDLAWNSLTSIIARLSAVPMSRLGGWYGWALWIPSFVIMFCTLIVIAYIVFERRVPEQYRPTKGSQTTTLRGVARWKFAIYSITQLPMFFWILCEIFQNAARTVYSVNLADIQEKTRGTSTLAAGYNSSLQNIVTVFMVPAIGLFFDKFGWRMPFVSIGAALYIVVFALIGLTTVHPLGPIVLSSFALSMNVIPFIGSIPILVNDPSKMGTAYGVWSSFVACNNILLEVTAGAVQDATPGQSYERVIYLLIAIKAVQVVLGPVYDYLDGRLLGHSLRRSEKRRLEMRDEKLAKGEEYPGWKVHKPTTWFFGLQYAGMVLVSWVIFFVYSVARR